MTDVNRTDPELLDELERLQAKIRVLEQAESAHQRADEVMQGALAYLDSIVNTAHECLIVLDADLRVRTANQSFLQTFQVKPHQIEGCLFYEAGHGEWDLPELRMMLERVLRDSKEIRDFEVSQKFASIGQKTMLLNARHLAQRGQDHKTNMVLIAINDITERKQAEEAMAQYARSLAQSNEELEQFAYVASHDLQEPLRMVTSYLQLLERRYKYRLDPEADKFIAYAVDGAARMKALITDLLAFSRVGNRTTAYSITDCNAVLARALANLKPMIEETGAEIISDSLPSLTVDGGQMVQVFQNLISNAIKFHSERPPRVTITAQQEGPIWVFAIRDNGIGIESQYLDRIFVLFRRLHSLGEYPGTGIGLAICRKIIEKHGGRIWVESTPGEGSTFSFTIPAVPFSGEETT